MSGRERWSALSERFLALQARERALVTITLVVVILLGGWQLGVAPEVKRAEVARAQTVNLQRDVQDLESRLASLQVELAKDPNQSLRQQQARLETRLDELQAEMATVTSGLVSPEAMVDLLRQILSKHQSLTLEAVSYQTATPVLVPGNDAGETPDLYRHGVTVTVSGRYFDLLTYLRELESLDDRLGWSALEYEVEEWPRGRMQIHLKTLSLNEEWLGV